jgi:two-component system sensor histidine kinase RpfC
MSTDQIQNPPEKDSSHRLKLVHGLFGWTGSPEQEQAALRIAIPVSVFVYLLLNKPAPTESLELWTLGIKFVLTFLVFALIIYASTIFWPHRSPARRVIGILVDTIGQSYALYITGPLGAPWYGLYLWIILGNGFRYGEKYLYLSTTVSLIGFACVAKFTPYWTTHTGLAIGLAFTLLLIPAYSALLIRRLNEARQRADDASRAKSDFLSCMSHEIRTPLNGILGMTDLLKLRPLDPQDRECVETIHVSGQALARQINEILDLSKIEAGQLTLEQIEFDLYVLVNTTLRVFHPQIEGKHLQLQEIIDPQTPFLLTGDPHKLQQIIINLVGNAIKFTEQGIISVRIHPRNTDTGQAVLRFEVADTGTGIPADRIHAIFEPFTQADNSVSRSYGGTGLGTTICKNLVELMGGQIGVHSTLGVGTTFWFDIPFMPESQDTTKPGHEWTSQCKVLYLNPQGDAQDGIPASLKEWNMPFDVATSLDQAAGLLSSQDNHAALIIDNTPYDQRLAEIISGEDTSLPGGARIILIRSEQYPADVNGSNQDRVVVLDPPLEGNILFNVLHACYSKHSTEEDIIHFSHKQVSKQQPSKPLDILIADDNATNRIVLQRMLEKLGHQHTVVTGGEAILTSLEDKQYDAVIADKNMPDLGGLEAYQAYCFAHGGNPPVPFIILTADATEESRASCKAAGIDLFLTKPVSLVRLQEALSSTQAADTGAIIDAEPEDVQLDSDLECLPVLDEDEFEKLTKLTAGDNNFVIELVSNFETDARKDLRGLESAVAGHNRAAFSDHAHALKGCALYLGLTRLAQLSKAAQNLDLDEFNKDGIAHVQAITHATNDAIRLLQDRITALEKRAIPN